jgi:2-dehydro-3-deoxygalactonokinase
MQEAFLSCDWGTSAFRLRLIDVQSGNILAESSNTQGIGVVYTAWKKSGNNDSERIDFYLAVINKAVKAIEKSIGATTDNIPIIISGMASSTIGMIELPYAKLPFSLNGNDLQYIKTERTDSFLHELIIISGACTYNDVMRGEETQLIGCSDGQTGGKHFFIFPGTHSKHVLVVDGKATQLRTHMTGEFFELLSKKSILADSIAAGGAIEDAGNKAAFEKGVAECWQENLLNSCFMVRTNQLFNRYSKTENYFYLSGLLIGAEIRELINNKITTITIAGNDKLALNYILALKLFRIETGITIVDASTATIKGQMIIYKRVYS